MRVRELLYWVKGVSYYGPSEVGTATGSPRRPAVSSSNFVR